MMYTPRYFCARALVLAPALFLFWLVGCAGFNVLPDALPTRTGISAAPTPTQLSHPTPTESPSVPTPASTVFDGQHAYDEYLVSQMRFGARPAGSKALRATGDYIIAELEKNGWQVKVQEFMFRGMPLRNIIGTSGAGEGPLLILGAHYDTRPRANMDKVNPQLPVPGANDGASGVAVLLELARSLNKERLNNEIWLAFFDAEDNGSLSTCDLQVAALQAELSGCDRTPWTWSVGAEHAAENLTTIPDAVVVVDMIGDADQNIYYEHNSDKELQETLWNVAKELGYSRWFIPEYRWSMTDDHTPFLKRGIRAVDLIDFDYPAWHTVEDTADKVSAASLERVGRVLETWLEKE
jgi:hypothetical protein